MGRNIAQLLAAAGETVIDVPAKLASRVRINSTGRGNKTDDTDAGAVARAALHSRNLRRVTADDSTVRLKTVDVRSRTPRRPDALTLDLLLAFRPWRRSVRGMA